MWAGRLASPDRTARDRPASQMANLTMASRQELKILEFTVILALNPSSLLGLWDSSKPSLPTEERQPHARIIWDLWDTERALTPEQ